MSRPTQRKVLSVSESSSEDISLGSLSSGGNESEGRPQAGGLNIATASIFIIGAICGSGVLAIPQAIVDCGFIGPVVLVTCGAISSFTGNLLGKCWTILRVRYPEYNSAEHISDPYPTIAFRAAGKAAKYATRVCIDITLFGGAIVFLLLIAGNISELICLLNKTEFSLCYIIMIATVALAPLTWLGTPKDFWQAAAAAAITSVLAAIFAFASMVSSNEDQSNAPHSNPEWSKFFSAFGTILFAFGGASCFPTIQVDMKEPNKFPVAVVIGIISVMFVYLLVGVTGLVLLGDKVEANIIDALPRGWMTYTVIFLITIHLLMAVVIVTNPVAQGIEGALGVPNKFCLRRIIVRTLLLAAAMFIGLTIPHFSVILSILGGSTIALTNFIFPPFFYYRLSQQRTPSAAYGSLPSYVEKSEDSLSGATSSRHVQDFSDQEHFWAQVDIPLHIKVLLFEIIFIGIVGGASSTYFSFASLVNGESGFTVPCYVNISVGLPGGCNSH